MKMLFVGPSYNGTAHSFRQFFFDEFKNQCDVYYTRMRSFRENFNKTAEVICNGKPDVVILFTISKCGCESHGQIEGFDIDGLQKFKGLVVLYECDAESYWHRVYKYLDTFKNIRLATFEFYPDTLREYPVEHKLWLPPTITPEDKLRYTERIYNVGHCGNYAAYRGWHKKRIEFVRNIMPKLSFPIEIRGERLEEIGRESCPIRSSERLSLFANQVKIMLAFPTKWLWLTHQYFYPLANGCLVVGIKPQGFDQQMIPECLVEVRQDFADLEEKVKYYLDHENERDILIQKAHNFVQQNHTVQVRVKTLLDKIKNII